MKLPTILKSYFAAYLFLFVFQNFSRGLSVLFLHTFLRFMQGRSRNSAFFFWCNHPALWLAGCFAAGIGSVARLGPVVEIDCWFGLAGIGCIGALTGLYIWNCRPLSLAGLGATMSLALAVYAGGAAWMLHRTAYLPDQHVTRVLLQHALYHSADALHRCGLGWLTRPIAAR